VKTGLIPAEIGDRFKAATQLHHDADLGAKTPPDNNRLSELLADAENFLTTTRLSSRNDENVGHTHRRRRSQRPRGRNSARTARPSRPCARREIGYRRRGADGATIQDRAEPLGSTGAYLLGLMPPELIRLLDIDIPVIRRDPHYFLPTTGKRYLLFGSDQRAMREQFISFFSEDDWRAHEACKPN